MNLKPTRGAFRISIGRSLFISFLPLFAALSGISPAAAESEVSPVRIACEPALEKLVVRWGSASRIPVGATQCESIHALRYAAAHRADFALVLGELSPGERSLLTVRGGSRPEFHTLGWEVPRFLAKADAGIEPVRWNDFLGLLRGEVSEGFAPPSGWRSVRSSDELRARFLPHSERKEGGIEGFETSRLEALAARDILGGSATVGLFFSLATAHPDLVEIPVLVGSETLRAASETVRRGAYPLAKPVLLVSSRPLESGGAPLAFSEFVLGATGQREVERAGFLPLDPEQRVEVLRLKSPGRIPPIHR